MPFYCFEALYAQELEYQRLRRKGVFAMRELYRREALKKLTSPEQIDRLISIVSLNNWLALITSLFLTGAIIIWLFCGEIFITEDAKGLFIRYKGIKKIVIEKSGFVRKQYVENSSFVNKDEIIAKIQEISLLEDMGLNSADELLDVIGLLNDPSSESLIIENFRKKVQKFHRGQAYYELKSPARGRLVSCFFEQNDFVRQSDVFGVLESAEVDLGVMVFVPLVEGKRLKEGMEIHISPSTVNAQEYGFIYGKISKISDFPITRAEAMKYLQNEVLVDEFLTGGPKLGVHVNLEKDSSTVSGFKWSLKGGFEKEISSGTPCSAAIILSRVSPISFILSIL